jgi:hypothetical protein
MRVKVLIISPAQISSTSATAISAITNTFRVRWRDASFPAQGFIYVALRGAERRCQPEHDPRQNANPKREQQDPLWSKMSNALKRLGFR